MVRTEPIVEVKYIVGQATAVAPPEVAQLTLLVVVVGAAAADSVVETISALAVTAALPAAFPAVNVPPLIVPSVAVYETDWQETLVPPSKHCVDRETDWPASTEEEEGVTLQEYPATAAEAMPIRAKTTNTDNIDEPFLMCTTLAYFAFYLFIILVPCERRLDGVQNSVRRARNGRAWRSPLPAGSAFPKKCRAAGRL